MENEMRMRSRGLSIIALLALAACGREPAEIGSQRTEIDEPEFGLAEAIAEARRSRTDRPVAEPEMAVPYRAEISVREEAPYGRYLTNAEGMPLYVFTADTRGEATDACGLECRALWPPALTWESPSAGDPGVEEDLLGVAQRPDATRQVTYAGWPLYTYVHDAPGRVTGQDIHSFDGEWYLLSPSGERIEATERHASR